MASFAYGYDAGSNVLSITDNVVPGFSRSFAYDDLSRLITAGSAGLWGDGSYEYDNMGNMTVSRLGAAVRTFTHTGTTPLLASVADGSGTFMYDMGHAAVNGASRRRAAG